MKLFCCPEEIICNLLSNHDATLCCDECEAPICKESSEQFFPKKPEMPAAALTNGMTIYYAPEEFYAHEATAWKSFVPAYVCHRCIAWLLVEMQRLFLYLGKMY